MTTTFYGLTRGATVTFVGPGCRRGKGKPVVAIGATEWTTADERALFAARVPHRDTRAEYDRIIAEKG